MAEDGPSAPRAEDRRPCPRCAAGAAALLTRIVVESLELDACSACRGVWLDADEWTPLVGRDRAVRHPKALALGRPVPRCPKCPPPLTKDGPARHPPPLVPRRLVDVPDLEVDLCETCGGAWLDAGELQELRTHFAGEPEAPAPPAPPPSGPAAPRVRAAHARDEREALTFLEALKDTWANLWR